MKHPFNSFELAPDSAGQIVLEDPGAPDGADAQWDFRLLNEPCLTKYRIAIALERQPNEVVPLPVRMRSATSVDSWLAMSSRNHGQQHATHPSTAW